MEIHRGISVVGNVAHGYRAAAGVMRIIYRIDFSNSCTTGLSRNTELHTK